MVTDFFDLKPMTLPTEVWKDQKRLSRFLFEVHDQMNRLVKACQQQTRLTARELVARPTYAEEFENIRESVQKVVKEEGTARDFSPMPGISAQPARLNVR